MGSLATTMRALAPRFEVLNTLRADEFVARDLERERVCRLRVPDVDASFDFAAFVAELERVATLRHPHLVAIEAWGRAEGVVYVVSPWIEGVSLRTWLGREPQLGFLECVRVLRELTSAVAYARREGVASFALTPDDVVWSNTHAFALDVGLEQALDVASATRRASVDVALALGALGYEMLAGCAPARERAEAVNKLRAHIPPGLAYLVMRCLDADRDRRPTPESMLRVLEPMVTPAPGYAAPQRVDQARFFLRRGASGLARALERFEQAAALAPDLAAAHAGVAETCALSAFFDCAIVDGAATRASSAARLAFELDALSASSHTALGWCALAFDRNEQSAREQFVRAIEQADAPASAHFGYALVRASEGSHELAIEHARRAVELEPDGEHARFVLGWTLQLGGREREALDVVAHDARALAVWRKWTNAS